MRKIIAIGAIVLDTLFINNQTVKSLMGGRIANAAASLAKMGMETYMVSECCTDHVGNLLVGELEKSGVNVRSVDRYTEGSTAFSALFKKGESYEIINYRNYPADRFSVIWPRIDNDDIVLFGSFYSIDLPVRKNLYEFLRHAVDMKAILIYLPGCQHGISSRLTKVMPGILENFEISNLVIAREQDCSDIYAGENGHDAYKNHIEFYCPNFLNIQDNLSVRVFSRNAESLASGGASSCEDMLQWQAKFVAGVVRGIIDNGVKHRELEVTGTIANATLKSIVENALRNQ